MDHRLTAHIIKEQCKNRSVTAQKLLADCGIRKSLIYDLEKRNWTPSAEVIERIADRLDCSVDFLLGRTDKPEVNR